MLVKFGIENRIKKNEYIYSYDENKDLMNFEMSSRIDFVRYAFTCDSVNELNMFTKLVVKYMNEIFLIDCKLLIGWDIRSKMFTKTRLKLLEINHRKNDFEMTKKGNYLVALRPSGTKYFNENIDIMMQRNSYVIWDDNDQLANIDMANYVELIKSSARAFAAPSGNVLDTLENSIQSFAYIMHGENTRPGLIILSRKEIIFEFKIMLKYHEIDVMLTEDANDLWSR